MEPSLRRLGGQNYSSQSGCVTYGIQCVATNYSLVKSKLDDGEVAYVTFSTADDASAARKACATLFPHLGARLVREAQADQPKNMDTDPSDTLCVLGYAGSHEELRRYFHPFRLDIRDIRRRTFISLPCIYTAMLTGF